jgi:hypothetical protein
VYFLVPVISATGGSARENCALTLAVSGFEPAVPHGDGGHWMTVTDQQGCIGRSYIRSTGRNVAIASQQVKGTPARIGQHASPHGFERMQTEFQRGDDAKIAASTTNGPE